jgi:hypothetical protein
MGKLVAAKIKVTEQELPDTNWRVTARRPDSRYKIPDPMMVPITIATASKVQLLR